MPKKDEPVTLDDIYKAITELHAEFRTSAMEQALRMESSLVGKPFKKKEVVNKGADVPARVSNTMYWWAAMYASKDPCIQGFYTEEDVAKAEKECTDVKEKPNEYDQRRAVGLHIWHSLKPELKNGKLKTMFNDWKIANMQKSAKDVGPEPETDDEKGDEKPKPPAKKAKAKPPAKKKVKAVDEAAKKKVKAVDEVDEADEADE